MSAMMIEQSVARLFTDHVDRALVERGEHGHWPAALWSQAEAHGLAWALASEAAGGIGVTWSEAYPILRGLGYWQVPMPLAETMVASLLLSLAGTEVPRGPITLVDESAPTVVAYDGAAPSLVGHAARVPWARHCRWALASTGAQIALVDLHDARGVRIVQRSNVAAEPSDDVNFNACACVAHAPNPLPGLDRPIRTLAAIARGAMMVGAMERVLEHSVQYATDRVQFGRAIGSYQAIQQSLALMAGDVAAARVAAMVACADAPSAGSTACAATLFSAAAAKIRTGEAATRAAAIAHQVHGAIGFTREHPLHFATRRLWAWRDECGSDAWWAQRLGEAAIASRSAGFWPALTRRHFDSGGRA